MGVAVEKLEHDVSNVPEFVSDMLEIPPFSGSFVVDFAVELWCVDVGADDAWCHAVPGCRHL